MIAHTQQSGNLSHGLTKANKTYLQAFESKERYCLLWGGAGSGKSVFTAQKILHRIITEQYANILVVRQTHDSMRDSVFALFRNIINDMNAEDDFHFDNQKMRIMHKETRNKIITKGLDDPKRLLSIAGITSIWVEEAIEISEDAFDMLDTRLRSILADYEQIILTFNPINETHWIRKRFFDEANNVKIESTFALRTTYNDNRKFLPKAYIETLERFALTNPTYYQIFALAEWANPNIGFTFKSQHYIEFSSIPSDAKERAVIYADPNLSLQNKGDTTAIIAFGFSVITQTYYVLDAVCKSFDSSNDLIEAVLNMKMKFPSIRTIGFDGNVSQESSWTNHIRNYSRIHSVQLPFIEFKRYKVDDLAKNVSIAWNEKRIMFPLDFQKREREFISQIFNFKGKKAKQADDAPDALICAFEMLNELGFAKYKSLQSQLKAQ